MNKQLIQILFALTLSLTAFSQSNNYQLISSNELELTVDAEFPIIKQYKLLKNNAVLKGNISNKKVVLINGIEFHPNIQ